MIDLSHLNTNSSGAKESPDAVSYGTNDGKIYFGYLFPANIKMSAASAMAGLHLQGYNSLHYMSFIKNGPMQGATINRSPGPHQIICASEHAGKVGEDKGIGYFLFAENGDIVIRAPRGRVRISGMDVDIRAEGVDSSRGTINLDSNQSVNIKTGSVDVKASIGAKIFTPKSIDIVANTSLTMVSNFVKGLTAISALRPSKDGINTTKLFNKLSDYR